MKKIVKLFLILTVVLMCLSLTACGGSTTKVDLSQYLSVSYVGFNGDGTALVDFDFADFEYGIMSQWKDKDKMEKLSELTAVEMTITYAADVSTGLQNGEAFAVKIELDEELAKEYGYCFTGLEKIFTVEGLPEPIMIDPFAEDIFGVNTVVTTTVEGIDPFLILTVRNNAGLNDPIGHITYKADHDWNFKNNEEIKITATMDQKFADQGYMLTRTEMMISFDGFERYVSSASDLTNVVLHRISERAYQECVNGGNVDIFDGSNNMTPWGATIENIHVGDTALLAVNNQIEMEYSFLLVPVYKTIFTEEWYDMDAGMNTTKTWENVIGYYKFTDLIIQSDGSVTFNESYVELNGNYTDTNTADALYLNQLRSNYSFIEVSMP